MEVGALASLARMQRAPAREASAASAEARTSAAASSPSLASSVAAAFAAATAAVASLFKGDATTGPQQQQQPRDAIERLQPPPLSSSASADFGSIRSELSGNV